MRYTPLERQIHTLYVPEDFIDRLADRAAAGDLFPGSRGVPTRITQRQGDHLRVRVASHCAAWLMRFNELDVWRMDSQNIQFRVRYRPERQERLREFLRGAPSPVLMLVMLPIIGVLAFLAPELLLMPVFGMAASEYRAWPVTQPLVRKLKAIADGAE